MNVSSVITAPLVPAREVPPSGRGSGSPAGPALQDHKALNHVDQEAAAALPPGGPGKVGLNKIA